MEKRFFLHLKVMNLSAFLSKIEFSKNPEEILSHIHSTNPHKEGSPRDALTHGISDVYSYFWSSSPIELDLDIFANINFEFGLHKGNLKRYLKKIEEGSLPPPIIVTIDENGKFWCRDGSHRVAALKLAGKTHVNAYIGIQSESYKIID